MSDTSYDSFGNPVPIGSDAATSADVMSPDATPSVASSYNSPGFDFSKVDWGSMLSKYGPAAVGSFLGASGILNSTPQKSGFQGKIPQLAAVRQQLPIDYNAPRRPGSMGRRYFTDMAYAPKSGIAAVAPVAPAVATPVNPTTTTPATPDVGGAHGGMIGYAQGGLANLGYYLGGQTDGMADKIPAQIDEKQQAKLSHGEFIFPADVVSALGSGNSSAGAKVLYDMMDRIRKHAHGTTKQIKPANLKKTLPA